MDYEKELPGFVGSHHQIVLSAYLEALSVEQRDRVIVAPCLEPFVNNGRGQESGPCLVQAAEDRTFFWAMAPVSVAVGRKHGAYDYGVVVPRAFDYCAERYGKPFIHWLKAECARLNGSSPSEIATLSEAATPPVAQLAVR